MKLPALLGVAFLVTGCSRSTPPALAEVVLRERLSEVPAEFVACISVDRKDASRELVSALKSLGRSVVPASECTWIMDANKGSVHPSSGRKAILMDVTAHLARGEVEYVGRHHGKWAIFMLFKGKVSESTRSAWMVAMTMGAATMSRRQTSVIDAQTTV